MKEQIEQYLKNFNFDIRKSRDARFMDQKVTPDVLCIMADCVLNHTTNRDIEFTKDDIWKDQYFIKNVRAIFNKPDAKNKNVRLEFDKFTSQPLKTLAYAQILSLQKRGNKNWYQIINKPILEYISLKERNSYNFLYVYLLKILEDSDLLRHFEEFNKKCKNKVVDNNDFQELKNRYIKFIKGNTKIKKELEIKRIFPKVLNIYACENFIQGTIRGHLSKERFSYSDLMYNRVNWRDVKKVKHISRNEAETLLEQEALITKQNPAYSDYQVQKAMNKIRKMYKESEVRDQLAIGEATHIHHIFPRKLFPQLASYLENLIKLTATQHDTKAHPSNKTREINRDYQLICLLAKSDNIEKSINRGEFVYRKESFIFVINTGLKGLTENLEYNLGFEDIRKKLASIYNHI